MSDRHVGIAGFQAADGGTFLALNMAWLRAHGLFEPLDEEQLRDPHTHILRHGGEIFMAKIDAMAVGCCAAIPRGGGTMEIAKLAVDTRARRQGIGRRLVEAALVWGQQRQYTKAVLTSNRRLAAALKLYESIGFQYAALPDDVQYETADVYMELDLTAWAPSFRS